MQTNQLAADLLDNSQLLNVLDAMKNGDFSVRMPLDCTGIAGKIADTVNEMIDRHERLTGELKRVSTVVGKEGKTTQRAALDGARGAWKDTLESFNDLIVDLVQPTTEVARVIGAVANGDLSQTMSLEIDGRPLTGECFRTANTINTMVDQLNGFASEVTRVAREVGTEGKLGGQAEVKGWGAPGRNPSKSPGEALKGKPTVEKRAGGALAKEIVTVTPGVESESGVARAGSL